MGPCLRRDDIVEGNSQFASFFVRVSATWRATYFGCFAQKSTSARLKMSGCSQ
jgi:hypothetical protein